MLTSNNRELVKAAMYAKNPHAFISWNTLNSSLKTAIANANTSKISGDTHEQYNQFDHKTDANNSNTITLTTAEDKELLQSIAKQRDEMNKGMSRKDMIVLITELHSTDQKAAENHLDYLIRKKLLPQLKKGGACCGCSSNNNKLHCNHCTEVAMYV